MRETPDPAGIDLDALDDEGGMDAALAAYRAEGERGRRNARPPWLSVLAVILGLALCVKIFPELRYWLDRSPTALSAVELADPGALVGLEEAWVGVSGTPDVTHIVPIKRKSGRRFGFMRITEADDRLFVMAPRRPEQDGSRFDGAFDGRLRRADSLDAFEFLRSAYELEQVRRAHEVAPAQLRAWLEDPAAPIETREGPSWTVEPDDQLSVVLRPAQAIAQLGRRDWKSEEAAEAAVAGLGRPYLRLEPTRTVHDDPDADRLPNTRPYHAFLISVRDEADADALAAELNAGKDLGDGSDPSRGALLLPRILAYTLAPGDLRLEGDDLVFPYGDNTASPGHRLDAAGERLVARELASGELRVPFAELELARLERPIELRGDAMVLLAGERPDSARMSAMLFALVSLIVALNAAALYAGARKRRA